MAETYMARRGDGRRHNTLHRLVRIPRAAAAQCDRGTRGLPSCRRRGSDRPLLPVQSLTRAVEGLRVLRPVEGGADVAPLRSQLPLELERRNLEGRWRPWGTLLCVNFMTLGQYLQGQMRSNVVKSAIFATFLRLHADNSKSYRPIFFFLSLYVRPNICEYVW